MYTYRYRYRYRYIDMDINIYIATAHSHLSIGPYRIGAARNRRASSSSASSALHATQNGHQPATQAQPGIIFAGYLDSSGNSDRRLTGSTREPVPATAVVISGTHTQR